MIVCPTVGTGGEFVSRALAHIDCQATSLGQGGYLALANPASPLPTLLMLGLTLFVAIYGFRLLLGQRIELSEVIMAAVKVGFVLALATSWPAMRTLLYDTIIFGPDDLATPLGLTGAAPGRSFAAQLQTLDNGIVELTRWGTGRLDIQVTTSPDGQTAPEAFRGTAIADAFALGFGRYGLLASALGSVALVRIGAGLLLALAPLFAGLLLFDATRSFFAGWLRALAMLALSSLAVAAIVNIELAMLDPWLRDALSLRSSNYAVASAPTELMVMTSGFAIATFGIIALIGRLCFSPDLGSWARRVGNQARHHFELAAAGHTRPFKPALAKPAEPMMEPTRAFRVAEAIAATQRREAQMLSQGSQQQWSSMRAAGVAGRAAANKRAGENSATTSMMRAPSSGATRKTRVSGLGNKRDRTI